MRIVSRRLSNGDPRRIRGLSVLPVFFHWKVRHHSFAAQIAEIAQRRGKRVKSLRRLAGWSMIAREHSKGTSFTGRCDVDRLKSVIEPRPTYPKVSFLALVGAA